MNKISDPETCFPPHGSLGNCVPSKGNCPFSPLINPEAAPRVFANVILGFALAEATGLFGLVVALLLLFVL